jgi:hypothetical protein
MWDNPNIREAIIAASVVLAVASISLWYLTRLTAPASHSRHSTSLESRLMGVVGARLRELEVRPYAELAALPPTRREDKVSPSGRRFYILTMKEQQADGTLAITVQVVEIKRLGRGKRVAETLYASPPTGKSPA